MQQSKKSLTQSYSNKNFKTRTYTPEVFSNSIFESVFMKQSPGENMELSIDTAQLQQLLPSKKKSSVTQVQSPNRDKTSKIAYLFQKIGKMLSKHDGIIKKQMPSLYQKISLQRDELKNKKLNFQFTKLYSYKYPEMELQLLQYKQREYEGKIKSLESEKKLLNLENSVQHESIKSQIKYYKEHLRIVQEQLLAMSTGDMVRIARSQSEEVSSALPAVSASGSAAQHTDSGTQTPLDDQVLEDIKLAQPTDKERVEEKINDDDVNPIEENYEHDGVLLDESYDTATENTNDFDDSEFAKLAGDFRSVPDFQRLRRAADNDVILEIDHVNSYNNIPNIEKAAAILTAAFSANNLDSLDNNSFQIVPEDEKELHNITGEEEPQEKGGDEQKLSMKAYGVLNGAFNTENDKENLNTQHSHQLQ